METLAWIGCAFIACVMAWLWGAVYGGHIVREIAVNAVLSETLPTKSAARIIGRIQGRPAEWVREELEKEGAQ